MERNTISRPVKLLILINLITFVHSLSNNIHTRLFHEVELQGTLGVRATRSVVSGYSLSKCGIECISNPSCLLFKHDRAGTCEFVEFQNSGGSNTQLVSGEKVFFTDGPHVLVSDDCGEGIAVYKTDNMNSIVIACPDSKSWFDAKNVCTGMGTTSAPGYLIEPSDPQKNPNVEQAVQQATDAMATWHGIFSPIGYWIGAKCESGMNTECYQWQSTSNYIGSGFQRFDGQPKPGYNPTCVLMDVTYDPPTGNCCKPWWDQLDCNDDHAFVCELKLII